MRKAYFFIKKSGFQSTPAIKHQRRLEKFTNLMMVYSYHYYFIELSVALVDFQMWACPSRMYHILQREYVLLYDIDFEGGDWNICLDCVDKLGDGGK